jgi:uncharacterized protein YodC (DUF2158 family)
MDTAWYTGVSVKKHELHEAPLQNQEKETETAKTVEL